MYYNIIISFFGVFIIFFCHKYVQVTFTKKQMNMKGQEKHFPLVKCPKNIVDIADKNV